MTATNNETLRSMVSRPSANNEIDLFEDNQSEPEVFPLPKVEREAQVVQAATSDAHIPDLSMHLCDVCGENEMHGVFGSSCGPISFAYCFECANKGAEPYGALVAYISSAYGVRDWDNPATQLHYRNSRLVNATLEVAGKSFGEWVADVRKLIITSDEEMNEYYRKEQLENDVIENTDKVFSFSELSGVFSKPEDERLTEIVANKYGDTMALLVDYHGGYHLFHVRDQDQFSYHNRVDFLHEGDPRLNG
ncbi:hypothetical protein [Escherichia coli]|uniref:hypothetical protein n=1 Tax=Escherichia coli TaxID=562 RepID=UPI0002A205B1|nr:hypothetical protein [Escherichia coli]ELC54766.1 hypothetical protein WGI_05098 [Escherichia coli KTE44]